MTIAPDICETGIDVVYLLTVNPDHVFTSADLDAVYDAEHLGFISISIDGNQRPTLVAGVTYCVTCLLGCDHESGHADSCGHAGCWGTEATYDCPGQEFLRVALAHMTGHDWQVAEARLSATAVAR